MPSNRTGLFSQFGPKDVEDLLSMHSAPRRFSDLLKTHGGVEGIAKKLSTDVNAGIPLQKGMEEEDPNHLERIKVYEILTHSRFGSNELPTVPPKWWISHFLDALRDPILILLACTATVSIVLGVAFPKSEFYRPLGWLEGFAIIVAVLIVSIVTATNNWKKEKQFQTLNKSEKNQRVLVIRNQESQEIDSVDLVVGDVVQLNTGSAIPADGLYIEGYDVKVDESSMTGESLNQSKDTGAKAYMLSGCQVVEGTGKMLVLAVGSNSQWGLTIAKLQEPQEATPLQIRLKTLAMTIGRVGLSFAVWIFIIKTVGWLLIKLVNANPRVPFVWTGEDTTFIVSYLVISITVIAVAVPEGLPLAVTLSLSYSVGKMMQENQLVRHLSSCEVMGGATTICSDKTGTLTTNKMTVVAGYFGDEYYPQTEGLPLPDQLQSSLLDLVVEGICSNSTAELGLNESKIIKSSGFLSGLNPLARRQSEIKFQKMVIGNKTEGGLIEMVSEHFKMDYKKIREQFKPIFRVSFSSLKKKMITIIEKNKEYIMHVKGAGEIIVKLCTSYMTSDGTVQVMTDKKCQEILDQVHHVAQQGMRTISMGFKNLGTEQQDWNKVSEDNFTFICLLGIEDPVRPEVPDAVKECMKAGILVRMVTGDNTETSKKIAQQCGIYTNGVTMEGPEFRELYRTNKQKFYEMLPKLQVLSRSSPDDKYILVSELKKCGEIVAVTGDGTNDGPALKKANVGLAMGSGTAVAKEAADIIVMDDNFATIVTACKWGRGIYENIRKFLQFQLTVNVTALSLLVITAIASIFLRDDEGNLVAMPLYAIQLLWLNLIMNTFAALALATQRPENELLHRPPHGVGDNLITDHMIVAIVCQALYQLFWLLFLYFFGVTLGISRALVYDGLLSQSAATTNNCLVFNTFVWCQIFNQWNARKIFRGQINIFKGLFSNPLFLIIFVFTMGVQVAFVELGRIPFVTLILHTTGLDYIQWPIAIGIGFMCVPFHFAVVKPIQMCLPAHRKARKRQGVIQEQDDKKKH